MDRRGIEAVVTAGAPTVRPSAVLLLTVLSLMTALAFLPDYWDWDLHRLRAVIRLDVERMLSFQALPVVTAWGRWRDERVRTTARAETLEKARVTGSIEGLFDGLVTDLALQPDGSVLAVGIHTMGALGIARLRPDGTLDREFVRRASWNLAGDLVGAPTWVEAATDGGVLVGGSLVFRGVPHARIRFHRDGSLDTAWLSKTIEHPSLPPGPAPPAWVADVVRHLERPPVLEGDGSRSWEGQFLCGNDPIFDSRVQFIALQPDARALLSRIRHGSFALVRASQDGAWEERTVGGRQCDAASEGTARVAALAFQRDGGIVMAGNLPRTRRGSGRCENVALWRIAPDGTFDQAFRASSKSDLEGDGYGRSIDAVVVLADDRIVAGGRFNTVQGRARRNIVRLRANGTIDG